MSKEQKFKPLAPLKKGWKLRHWDIKIGHPLLSEEELKELGFGEFSMFGGTSRTDVRFIPTLLVGLGIFESTSEVKRNRPDCFQSFPDDFFGIEEVKIGDFWVTFWVGAKDPGVTANRIEEIRMESTHGFVFIQ